MKSHRFTTITRVAACSGLIAIGFSADVAGRKYEIQPKIADNDEEFENLAKQLRPGDELVLHSGTYSQKGRRAVTVRGTEAQPVVIRAATAETPLLTRPLEDRDGQNNIEFVDCEYLVVRGLRFQGGSSGVRFIRGHHVTFEDCEIFDTGNNALNMNSGNCHAFILRHNHIHHTGLSTSHPTEGEGMYIGCHSGSCRTTESIIENNYIHHLRGTSDGGNDGIEIKTGSYGNVVRNNVIHDTNIGRKYPGIFVYGGGDGTNLVEGNVVWNAGEGIQVVSDALVRNNVIFDCDTGISAAPHSAMPRVRNVTIVNNTIYNASIGVRMRWTEVTNGILANNAIYCPDRTAFDGRVDAANLRNNLVVGRLSGTSLDGIGLLDGGDLGKCFVDPARHDFWPSPGSPLTGRAKPEFAPSFDFNGTKRASSSDIGAFDSSGQPTNPGWKITEGFKR